MARYIFNILKLSSSPFSYIHIRLTRFDLLSTMYIIAFKINCHEANKFKEHEEERNAKIEDAKKEREKKNTNQKRSKGRQEREVRKEGENV